MNSVKAIQCLKEKIEIYNEKIDQYLYYFNLKKRPRNELEIVMIPFIESLVLNLQSNIPLEKAMQVTIKNIDGLEDLKKNLIQRGNAITAIHLYAQEYDTDCIWRLTQLIEQSHKTGNSLLAITLQKYLDELWSEKMNAVQKKAEKISVQLTFLLMISLISVIMVVVSPLILSF